MKLLLDTHALIWLAEGSEDLRPPAREAIDRHAAASGLVVSAISFWETAVLAQRGRISLSEPVEAWRARVLGTPAITEIPVDGTIAVESVRLPGDLHGDPADRFLVATARLRGFRLATRDHKLLAYGAEGHVRVLSV